MDINYKEMLKTQIKETYGQLVYTQTTHLKLMDRQNLQYSVFKWIQIALSAATTAGLIGTLITNEKAYTVISTIMSALLLFINLYFKNFNLKELASSHKHTADELGLSENNINPVFRILTTSQILISSKYGMICFRRQLRYTNLRYQRIIELIRKHRKP